MFNIALLAQESESVLTKILTGIPHDGPAIVLYLIVGAAVAWVLRAGRKNS